jgi:hypothetical protein
MFKDIYCQRFFVCCPQAKYFAVNVPSKGQTMVKIRLKGNPYLYRALINKQLIVGSYK